MERTKQLWMSSLGLMLAIGVALPSRASGDEPSAPAEAPARYPRIAFQGDLSAFAFHGMGWGLGVQPADHLRFNFINFGLDNPPFATEPGWVQRMRGGALFDARYYFNADDVGLSVSLAAGNVLSEYARTDTPGVTVDADQIIVGPTVGYRWFLTKGLYLEPFLGVLFPLFSYSQGVSSAFGGSAPVIGGTTYKAPLPVLLFPAFVLGYEWGR